MLEYPWMLICIVPLVAVFVAGKTKARAAIQVSTQAFFEQQRTPFRYKLVPILQFMAGVLVVVALAGPRYGVERVIHRADGIDIMISVDLSGSMQAYDIPKTAQAPKELLRTRLAIAKDEIRAFINQRPNDRIGLIGFGTFSYVACPATLDHGWLVQTLDSLAINSVGGNTGVAAPIANGVARLSKSDSKRKVMVLFTDGVNNVDARISPQKAAELAQHYGIRIYTVGIGSDNAYAKRSGIGQSSLQKMDIPIDSDMLAMVADKTSGRYYHVGNHTEMAEVMRDIDTLERTSREQPKYVEFRECAHLFAVFALGLLIIAFAMRNSFAMTFP